jgi:hypothetical protein
LLLNSKYFLITLSKTHILNKQKQQEVGDKTKATRRFYSSPKKIVSLMATLAILFLTTFAFPQNVFGYANPAPVDIGTANDFVVLTKAGIGNTGVSNFA